MIAKRRKFSDREHASNEKEETHMQPERNVETMTPTTVMSRNINMGMMAEV